MGHSGRRSERLASLALGLGVSEEYPGFHLSKTFCPAPTPQEINCANAALDRKRSQNFEAKHHLIRRKPPTPNSNSNSKEVTATLGDLINESPTTFSAGQVAHLIQLGADVNFARKKSTNLLKRARGKDQEDVRSPIFVTAVEHGNPALVEVLVDKADQTNIDEGLKVALIRRNLDVIKPLMLAGANPNSCEPQFRDAIQRGDTDLVRSLCSGKFPPSEEMVTKSLYDAVLIGDLRTVRILLWHGANADIQEPSALLNAVQRKRSDIVAALNLGSITPSPAHLAKAISSFCVDLQNVSMADLVMIEILLASGACGQEIAHSIVEATKRRQSQLVAKLVEYSDFDAEQSPKAIRNAAAAGDLELFQSLTNMTMEAVIVDDLLIFLSTVRRSVSVHVRFQLFKLLLNHNRPSPKAASIALLDASKHSELDIVDILFKAGALGEEVNEALRCACVKSTQGNLAHALINALVRGGADVNSNDGGILISVIANGDIHALNLLLKGRPTVNSLNAAFVSCLPVEQSDQHFNVLKLLIAAGACGSPIDRAFLDVLNQSHNAARFRQLFLDDGKANINFKNGESVCRVVRNGDVDLLCLLLKYEPNSTTLDNALTEAIQFGDLLIRLRLCRLIVNTGPGVSSEVMNQALADIVKAETPDDNLISTLLEKRASIDYNSGFVLRVAIQRQDHKLLKLLLTRRAKAQTLLQMLMEALKIDDSNSKLMFVQTILGSRTPLEGSSLTPLLQYAFDNSGDLRILRVILEKGALVDQGSLPAFRKASDGNNRQALELLVNSTGDGITLREIFDHVWTTTAPNLDSLQIITQNSISRGTIDFNRYLILAVRKEDGSQALVEFLLDMGAVVEYQNNQSLCDAATRYDYQTLKSLLDHVNTRQSVSDVFERTMKLASIWSEQGGPDIIHLLLDNGAFGETVDHNMLECIRNYDSPNAPILLRHLVSYGASADYQNGMSLEIAVREANLDAIDLLLGTNPSPATLSNAFPYVFRSSFDEELLLQVIEKFVDHSINLNSTHKELKPVLFLCMERFTNSTVALNKLLQHGASSEQTSDAVLVDEIGPEASTPLLWALSMPATVISPAIAKTLIEAEVDLKYTCPFSKFTALLVAVIKSRSPIVEKLLTAGAPSSTVDYSLRTPLCYASMKGDIRTMQSLIKFNAISNDGSLHHAVQSGQVEAVALLLNSGHDSNFPSPFHNSRNALELLVYLSAGELDSSARRAILKLLVDHGANKRYVVNGKSLLFLALDVPHATLITPILLSTFMGEIVNEDFNQYRYNGTVYSPCSYLVHNLQASHADQKNALLRSLASYGCKEVCYRERGPQSDDFVAATAPPHIQAEERLRREEERRIAEAERKRQQRINEEEEDHQIELRRGREVAYERQLLSKETHDMEMALDSERSEQRIELARKENREQTHFAMQKRNAEIAHTENIERLRLYNLQKENQLQLEYKSKAAIQDQAIEHAHLNTQQKMLEYARQGRREEEAADKRRHERDEGADKRRHARAMQEVEAKRSALREQGKLQEQQQRLLEYQRGNAQRAIAWDVPD